ncbi:hypothetical protein MKK69_24470 [Methylobacterium sp. J-026]|uniref:hypothetical protein n=1 Tax=Methylobacterium sp. J-026 TaxID=2836624 RepID=UPI001FBABB6F|nr:hypothetical protein [Methylobacterium sp. J-026]MCJ2137158.1 hypothetical protein [Methylobacterium sp. J-026]
MTNRLRLALLCALVTLPSAARAQAALRLDGTCEKLVIGTQDLSASCRNVLTNAVSRNRTSFDFSTSDGRTLSFSGNGAQQEATEETDPLQPINVVTTGTDAAPTLAIGACRFSTPEPGRTAITCEASAADGRPFAGTFVTVARAAAGAPAAPAPR